MPYSVILFLLVIVIAASLLLLMACCAVAEATAVMANQLIAVLSRNLFSLPYCFCNFRLLFWSLLSPFAALFRVLPSLLLLHHCHQFSSVSGFYNSHCDHLLSSDSC